MRLGSDGFHWTYGSIVLSDPKIRFSFPQVYKVNGTYFMVPDSFGYGTERIYQAQNFPYNWTFVSTLVSGKLSFADPSLFYYNNLWWMFVSDTTNSNLFLYYSSNITSGWTPHPLNPIIKNNLSNARPAGRTIVYSNGKILRFAQNCSAIYGQYVRAFSVDTLTTTKYSEHEIPESPLLGPSGKGWNSQQMHTFGAWWTGTNWIVSTDGIENGVWTIGIYSTATSGGSPTATPVPTLAPTPSPTATPVPTLAPTPSPTATPVPTLAPTPSPTATPVPTLAPTPSPTATPVPTLAPTPSPTATPVPTLAPTPSPTATPVPTLAPTPSPTATPVPTLAPTPSPTATPIPTSTPPASASPPIDARTPFPFYTQKPDRTIQSTTDLSILLAFTLFEISLTGVVFLYYKRLDKLER